MVFFYIHIQTLYFHMFLFEDMLLKWTFIFTVVLTVISLEAHAMIF